LSVKDKVPPPEILVDAINNRDSAEVIIEKLNRDAVAEGSVTMVATFVINGEECLAYCYQVKFISRSQQGEEEFVHVPSNKLLSTKMQERLWEEIWSFLRRDLDSD
jgi:hypothetical protein